jgi:transposase
MQSQIRQLDFTGKNIYAGIDVHLRSWKVSIYSEALYHKTFTQPPRPGDLYKYLSKHFPNGTYYSVYEAGFCGFWIHDELLSLGINNIVVNPADVPTSDKEKKQKTDRVDSNKLARHLRSGELDAIYVHQRDLLEDRTLVRTRRTVVKEITRYKNRIKSKLHFFGIELPEKFDKVRSYWSNNFMSWLSELELNRSSGTQSIRYLLDHVKRLRKDLLEISKSIRELSQSEYYRDRVKCLLSLHGIGVITAMIVLTEIDDIYRFANQDRLASYVGLTPTSHSSGDKEIHGEMINRGNKYLKTAIVESAWIAARRDPVLHLAYNEYCKRMQCNKAIIRIARKLLNRISFVLKNEALYQDGVT